MRNLSLSLPHLAQEAAVLLGRARLVPHGELQHVVAEVPAVDVSVDEGLVPLGLARLLHRFRPPLALVAAEGKQSVARGREADYGADFACAR